MFLCLSQVVFGLFFVFYFPALRPVEGDREPLSKVTEIKAESSTDYEALPDGEVGVFPERKASILSGTCTHIFYVYNLH